MSKEVRKGTDIFSCPILRRVIGIRGKCDKDVVAAASVAGVDRTIITNDKDFLFGVKNKMGVIVLWGGVGAEGSFQSFRSLKRKEKIKAIIVLFERYLSDMERWVLFLSMSRKSKLDIWFKALLSITTRVRNNGDRLLAVLSCQANDGTGDLTWEFKPPGDDMKIRYLLKKEAEATKAQNHN